MKRKLLGLVLVLAFVFVGLASVAIADDCPFTWTDVKDEMAFTWGECPETDQLVALIRKHWIAIGDSKDAFDPYPLPQLKDKIVDGEELLNYLKVRWVAVKAYEGTTECELIMWWIDEKPAFLTRNDMKRMLYDVKKFIKNIPNAHPYCRIFEGWTE